VWSAAEKWAEFCEVLVSFSVLKLKEDKGGKVEHLKLRIDEHLP
jgi:hypothetical protein